MRTHSGKKRAPAGHIRGQRPETAPFYGIIVGMEIYKTAGTCSSAIEYEVADGKVTACRFIGGCPGNTRGVAKLVVGRPVEEVVRLLKGIPCRNGTSCPDQLARALEAKLGVAGIA